MASIQQVFKHVDFTSEQHKAYAGLLYAGAMAEKHLEKTIEPFDISVNKLRILRGLKKMHPGGVGVYKLRDFLIDQKADISRLAEKMVQMELAERKPDPQNKSTVQIVITQKGIDLMTEVEKHLAEIINPAMRLSDSEATQLNQLIEKVITGFKS